MKQLIKGLRQFQSDYVPSHKALMEELSKGQHPRVLFIACSDSRVDPALITQSEIGDLFVIRNAGNIIPPYEATNGGEGATIEYAIEALGIKQVIICGHSKCGAMKGLLQVGELEDKMPLVYHWLRHTEATRKLGLRQLRSSRQSRLTGCHGRGERTDPNRQPPHLSCDSLQAAPRRSVHPRVDLSTLRTAAFLPTTRSSTPSSPLQQTWSQRCCWMGGLKPPLRLPAICRARVV
jgi:carbonic anhydrase